MATSPEDQLDAALLVRRRLQAELIACEADFDAATPHRIARHKLKMHHLDAMIARLERQLGHAAWWSLGPVRRLSPAHNGPLPG